VGRKALAPAVAQMELGWKGHDHEGSMAMAKAMTAAVRDGELWAVRSTGGAQLDAVLQVGGEAPYSGGSRFTRAYWRRESVESESCARKFGICASSKGRFLSPLPNPNRDGVWAPAPCGCGRGGRHGGARGGRGLATGRRRCVAAVRVPTRLDLRTWTPWEPYRTLWNVNGPLLKPY
jgi:hypothetical protein